MRRVLITGGGAGIGRVLAARFLAQGDQVAICDANPAALAAFQAEFPAAIAMQADVTDEVDMTAFLDHVAQSWGGIDIVCANAGSGGPAGPIETLHYGDWQACVATSLHGAFLTCRWAARLMKAQGNGVIILTSSTAGLFGYPNRAPYAAAKWAIVGLTKTLAMELGPFGVRVNAICPGAVEGPRMDRVIAKESAASGRSEDETRDLYVKGVSLRSWVSAEEVADTVAYLTSDAARKISGQILAIDGHTETLTP